MADLPRASSSTQSPEQQSTNIQATKQQCHTRETTLTSRQEKQDTDDCQGILTSVASTFDASPTDRIWEFAVSKHPNPTMPADIASIQISKSGTTFTGHIITVLWNESRGWHDAKVIAYGPLQIDPAAATLQYAQEVFESMHASKAPGENITLFRPMDNAHQFAKSAQRLAMEPVSRPLFIQAIEALSLRRSGSFTFCATASPRRQGVMVGGGASTVWVTKERVRAGPGGIRAVNCGENYASSLVSMEEAIAHGCEQVVFLDAAEHKYVGELGNMNIFFVMDNNSLVSPTLASTILPDITKESIFKLARGKGMKVGAHNYPFEEWRNDVLSGRVKEAFACRTPCGIIPVAKICYEEGGFVTRSSKRGPVTKNLGDELDGIKCGKLSDPVCWRHCVRLDAEALTPLVLAAVQPAPKALIRPVTPPCFKPTTTPVAPQIIITVVQPAVQVIQQVSILFVWTDVDPHHEADFSDWYDNEHLVECVNIAGMRSATRYGNTTKSGPRYINLYYAENLGVFYSNAY